MDKFRKTDRQTVICGKKTVRRRAETALLAAVLIFGMTGTSRAEVPGGAEGPGSSSRSAEEWAQLNDNVLEWQEIPGLVEEYNPKIRKELDAFEKNKDSVKTAEETAEGLLQAAEEYDSLAAEYDGKTGGQLAAANYRMQAEDLRQQAADNTGDKRVLWIGVQESIVKKEKEVRELFVSYYRAQKAVRDNEAAAAWQDRQAEELKLFFSRGLITQPELSAAEDEAKKLRRKQDSLETAAQAAYRKLITSCGWAYNAQAVIGRLPSGEDMYLSTKEDADAQNKALEQSFLLREDRVRLENARKLYWESDLTEKLEKQLKTDTETVSDAFETARESLRYAGKSVEAARQAVITAEKNCQIAEKQLEGGYISRASLEKKKHEKELADQAVEAAVLDLITARIAFDAVCKGVSG